LSAISFNFGKHRTKSSQVSFLDSLVLTTTIPDRTINSSDSFEKLAAAVNFKRFDITHFTVALT